MRKSDADNKVLIMKEDTAISLHLDSGLVSVQKRMPISDKDTGNGKKERKYEIELARESSHCKYIHRYKQEELPGTKIPQSLSLSVELDNTSKEIGFGHQLEGWGKYP